MRNCRFCPVAEGTPVTPSLAIGCVPSVGLEFSESPADPTPRVDSTPRAPLSGRPGNHWSCCAAGSVSVGSRSATSSAHGSNRRYGLPEGMPEARRAQCDRRLGCQSAWRVSDSAAAPRFPSNLRARWKPTSTRRLLSPSLQKALRRGRLAGRDPQSRSPVYSPSRFFSPLRFFLCKNPGGYGVILLRARAQRLPASNVWYPLPLGEGRVRVPTTRFRRLVPSPAGRG